MPIKKFLIWYNPSTMRNTEGPRWDANLVTDEGTTRFTRITKKQVKAIINEIFEAV